MNRFDISQQRIQRVRNNLINGASPLRAAGNVNKRQRAGQFETSQRSVTTSSQHGRPDRVASHDNTTSWRADKRARPLEGQGDDVGKARVDPGSQPDMRCLLVGQYRDSAGAGGDDSRHTDETTRG